MNRTKRTFICSVLFLDIAAYFQAAANDQIMGKQRLNDLLAEVLFVDVTLAGPIHEEVFV